jgi:filamentous hemagglutinin
MTLFSQQKILFRIKKPVAVWLGMQTLFAPLLSRAGTKIPGFYGNASLTPVAAGKLPSAQQSSGAGFAVSNPAAGQLVVDQSQANVVIDWNSFDIGAAAGVVFNQKNASGVAQPSWSALNRIHDANPSQIYGSLKSDGTVYLLNQNGILFGPGSTVNVGGMVAATLNIRPADIASGVLKFRSEDFDGNPLGASATGTAVSNFGTITASEGGNVYLLAPSVENGGSISAPYGNVGLIAAVPFTAANPRPVNTSDAQANLDYDVKIDTTVAAAPVTLHQYLTGGTASNFAGGRIVTDAGKTGMYGGFVNQNGLVRATTVVKKNGVIELLADHSVTTGAGSVTAVPVSDSKETVDATFSFTPGTVTLGALQRDATIANGDIGSNPAAPSVVYHQGLIDAPGGVVNLVAKDQVFLENGSVINVSGVWSDSPASAGLVNATLNTPNLRDNATQKDGTLQGATVTLNQSTGSAIGDVTGSLGSAPRTAQQLAQNGGSIILGYNISGDRDVAKVTKQIIVKSGAELDFQGGGIRYLDGYLNTTKLLNGTTLYDISTAPANLAYDMVLGSQTFNNAKFGVSQTFNGLYLGGSSPLNNLRSSYLQGSDAGSLALRAGQVVLNGTLNGNYAKGLLQTKYQNSYNVYGELNGIGLVEPAGGSLTVGENKTVTLDLVQYADLETSHLSVVPTVQALPDSFAVGDALPAAYQGKTLLSAAILNKAGLSNLNLYANDSITVERGAAVTLTPYLHSADGTSAGFSAFARYIENDGSITVPSGKVTLATLDNLTSNINGAKTSYFQEMNNGILLAEGSSISVGGERFDATLPAQAGLVAHTGGGSISLKENTTSGGTLTVAGGAQLDFSGGYQIGATGAVSGGNAGSLSLSALSLTLDGDLNGTALYGKDGGKLAINTEAISITPDGSAAGVATSRPAGMDAGVPMSTFNLADDRFAATGISQLSLTAFDGVKVAAGTVLQPSARKYQVTGSANADGAGRGAAQLSYLDAPPEVAGNSSISLNAGAVRSVLGVDVTNFDAALEVADGAAVQTLPGGKLSLSGPTLEISGRLEAPGGSIALAATRHDVNLNASAEVLARGYNTVDSSSKAGNGYNLAPHSGGSVTISSQHDLNLKDGALIDVSGAPAVNTLLAGSLDALDLVTQAGKPGSVSLAYYDTLNLAGKIQAQGYGPGLPGGSLFVSVNDPSNLKDLALTGKDVAGYLKDGFDALSFSSLKGIGLYDLGNLTVPRSLTLDAPTVFAGSSAAVQLQSPWIQLKNSSYPAAQAPASGTAGLTLKGIWVDLTGDLQVSGFKGVSIEAARDIRLTDSWYPAQTNAPALASGKLEISGDLTLKASRVYPTSQSEFTIQSDQGAINVLPGGGYRAQDPVYSALGSLNLEAATGINQGGVLLAPLGNISLNSPGRILLADGSVTSVAGSANVNIGTLDENFNWITTDRSGAKSAFTGLPSKGISISGGETVQQSGATLDLSGGGSVFSYQFVPGIEGSFDPVAQSGKGRADRFVIVPGSSYDAPGDAVYLSANNSLKLPAGTYTLLPESYAFVPGALIISRVGAATSAGSYGRTVEGYPVAAGYPTVRGTAQQPAVLTNYSVRSAAQVLKEGHFETKSLAAGQGGSLAVNGSTVILDGTVKAAAIQGFAGGSFTNKGTVINLVSEVGSDTGAIDATAAIPAALQGVVTIRDQAVSGAGFDTVSLGDQALTDTVSLAAGTTLRAANVNLAARTSLTLGSGVQVEALASGGSGGNLTVQAPALTTGSGSLLHGSASLDLTTNSIAASGGLQVDDGPLTLRSGAISFAATGSAPAAQGLTVDSALLAKISGNDRLVFQSGGDIDFATATTLTTAKSLTLDAARISGSADVALSSDTVLLKNSGASPAAAPSAGSAGLSVSANQLSIDLGNSNVSGKGGITLDGFRTVSLATRGDLVLKGVGDLATAGDLTLTAPRITTAATLGGLSANPASASQASDPATFYNAQVRIDALAGDLTVNRGAGTAGGGGTPGGSLQLSARNIVQDGFIDLPSGSVGLAAGNSVTLGGGSEIRARGSQLLTRQGADDLAKGVSKDGDYLYLPGGSIAVSAAGGSVQLQQGAVLDVSAAAQGDAGSIAISAPTAGGSGAATDLSGTLLGKAGSGLGGSFTLDAADSATLNSGGLLSNLRIGGFDNSLQLRFRSGDLVVSEAVRANEVQIAADGAGNGGNLTLTGTGSITAGKVELDARKSIALENGSSIDISAPRAGSGPGYAYLSAGDLDASGKPVGSISLDAGATIKGAADGVVHFRALRNTNDSTASGLNLALNGTLDGVGKVEAEAVRVYSYQGDVGIGTGTTTLSTKQLQTDTNAFMAQKDSILAGLGNGADARLKLLPGIEVRSTGSITVQNPANAKGNSDWDFNSWRDGTFDYYGVLTLRAANNLLVKTSIVDAPSPNDGSRTVATALDSWGMNLIAGADLSGANLLATTPGASGQHGLVLDSGKSNAWAMLYSETGTLRLASGGDASFSPGRSDAAVPYFNNLPTSVGTFSGDIEGRFGAGLTVKGGSIQSEAGNIDFAVAGNLTLTNAIKNGTSVQGAIRTTGINDPSGGDSYSGGGNLKLSVGGNLTSGFTVWDAVDGSSWSANYVTSKTLQATSGIATMAGGGLDLRVGGNFLAQAGSFGQGDLTLFTGGDLKGRVLNASGTATLTALGNLGLSPVYDGKLVTNGTEQTVIELLGGKANAAALGNINLGTVFNPTLADAVTGVNWNPTYTSDSAVRLTSLLGDVSIYGTTAFPHYGNTTTALNVTLGNAQLFPATLEISAGNDITFWKNTLLAPSATGSLLLSAGGSIQGAVTGNGWTTLQMIDVPTDYFYTFNPSFNNRPVYASKYDHDDHQTTGTPLHAGDSQPIEISAGADISGLKLYLPKQFEVSAGNDITDTYLVGENLKKSDASYLRAGHDLVLSAFSQAGGTPEVANSGIEMGGPGSLVVQAGNSIDLGSSQGITSYGAAYNATLTDTSSADLYVVAGYNKVFKASGVDSFFGDLLKAGTDYSNLLAEGKSTEAKSRIVEARNTVIDPYLSSTASDGEGTISMTESSINTNAGSSVNIITRSSIDVGKGSITSSTNSGSAAKTIGLYTAAGGNINIYSGSDVNVNESKVMTFFGGDIMVWSDTGNINAGRGSSAAVNAQPPHYVLDPVTGKQVLKFTPPAVGSGIRAITYDPNLTPGGTLEVPEPGAVGLFAPQGVIDAGEAGIAGGKVILGATEVLNSKNISFGTGSVGVPSGSEGGVSIGSLAGSGSVAENSKMIEQSSSLSAKDKGGPQANAVDDFMSRWLDLKIISFDGDQDEGDKDAKEKKDRKKKEK